MASRNTLLQDKRARVRGFTFIEVIVTIGIFVVILSFGLVLSIDAYRGYLFRAERTIVVSALERARSRAMTNYEQSSWGVCKLGASYQVFKGSTCASGDAIPSNLNVTVTGLDSGVVFSQLSGTTTDATITLSDVSRSATISVNSEGTVLW